MGNVLTLWILSKHISRFKQVAMAYFNVTACNSTGQATKTAKSIQRDWMVHCAELENMWTQSQYLLKHSHHTGRSQWPCCLRRGSAAARWLGLRVRIPPGSWMSVSCECCVSCQVEASASGWSLVQMGPTDCDVSEFDSEASTMRRPWPARFCCEMGKKSLQRPSGWKVNPDIHPPSPRAWHNSCKFASETSKGMSSTTCHQNSSTLKKL